MDLTATCINVSGEGLATIGAANFKLAPNGSGTSVQQMSLLRKSRAVSPIRIDCVPLLFRFSCTICTIVVMGVPGNSLVLVYLLRN